MDKDMIKIDDLLKQRLGDAEERERAGAWTNMRDLLDQQMPVAAGTSTNWRRMFAYVAGVLVLASLTVGGYEMVESFSGSGAEKTAVRSTGGNTYSGVISTATKSLPEGATAEELAEGTEENTPVQANAIASNSTTTKVAHTTTPVMTDNSNKQQPIASNNKPESIIPSSGNANKPAKKANEAITNVQKPIADNAKSTETAQNVAKQNETATAKNNAAENVKGAEEVTTDKQTSDVADSRTRTNDVVDKLATNNPQAIETDREDPEFEEERMQFRKIVKSVRTNSNGELEKDTIYNGTDELVVRKEKATDNVADKANADATADEENSGSNMMPAAAAPAATTAQNDNTAAAADNGKSKYKSNRYKNTRRFEELVKNAKVRMGKMKFYPGVVAGANTAFSKTNISGFQLGLAGRLSIDERWSILTEAKYVYHFNGKERLQDDYITNVQTRAIGGQSVITYDSVEHYYNFNNYASIEMPIAVSYKINKRLDVFGGVNMTYNFKIDNLQEVEHIHALEAGATSTNVNVAATDKTILLSDFKPSFGLGYVGGVGLQASNKLRFDLRITQPLMMKTSTMGQKDIANRLYKMPNMQLNMTFRLGGNKFKPYKAR